MELIGIRRKSLPCRRRSRGASAVWHATHKSRPSGESEGPRRRRRSRSRQRRTPRICRPWAYRQIPWCVAKGRLMRVLVVFRAFIAKLPGWGRSAQAPPPQRVSAARYRRVAARNRREKRKERDADAERKGYGSGRLWMIFEIREWEGMAETEEVGSLHRVKTDRWDQLSSTRSNKTFFPFETIEIDTEPKTDRNPEILWNLFSEFQNRNLTTSDYCPCFN